MADEIKFKQIAMTVIQRPVQPGTPREPDVLHLYGLGEDGVVYEYLRDVEAKVAGGGWKEMTTRKLP